MFILISYQPKDIVKISINCDQLIVCKLQKKKRRHILNMLKTFEVEILKFQEIEFKTCAMLSESEVCNALSLKRKRE